MQVWTNNGVCKRHYLRFAGDLRMHVAKIAKMVIFPNENLINVRDIRL